MLLSMTGFGKASGTFQTKKISIEIRALNSKSLDLNVRIANQYKELEPVIRNLIAQYLERGKIDLMLNLDSTGESKSVTINKDLAKAYYKDLSELSEITGEKDPDYMAHLLRMPDIFMAEKEDVSLDEKTFISDLLKSACDHLSEFRRQEGIALEREFYERIEDIRHLLHEVPKYENERITTVKDRMRKALDDLENKSYDDNRLQQELIFYIEKLDISEEKMRLNNHLDYFLATMKQEAAGKKLGFIAQEIGREINTLGSKSNHSEMQKLVVDMKDNLEKIKEQILNTL